MKHAVLASKLNKFNLKYYNWINENIIHYI